MLAYGANIHKVQGMQFENLRVNFELEENNSGNREFYQGMAYMALSRAEKVQIVGRITIPLLNNINAECMRWWENEVVGWNQFKTGAQTSKLIFRNNIHEANFRLASLHRRYLIVARMSVPSAIQEGDVVDIDIDDEIEHVSPPMYLGPAPSKSNGKRQSVDTVLPTPASKPFHPEVSIQTASLPAFASASTLAPVHQCDFSEEDLEYELVIGPPATKKQKQKPKLQTLVVKNFSRNSFDPMSIRGHASTATLTKMAAMLDVSIENLHMPEFKCTHHSHPDTYGEVTPALVNHMLKRYSHLNSMACEEQTAFVDLGSGHGGLVCLIATLRRFRTCFGVELEPTRASYADPLADSFLKEVQRRNIRHSNVEIIAGDFLKCETTKRNLQMASLIWVNNVKFQDFNYVLLKMLDELVPFGCVIVSFVSFITRQNDTRFRPISEDIVENAADWMQKGVKVYVIQKQ